MAENCETCPFFDNCVIPGKAKEYLESHFGDNWEDMLRFVESARDEGETEVGLDNYLIEWIQGNIAVLQENQI